MIICDLTGQLPRTRRQDLERRLDDLARGAPGIDAVEVDLEASHKVPGGPRERVLVTLRANHRRVAKVSGEAPTLAAALELAMADVARGEATGRNP